MKFLYNFLIYLPKDFFYLFSRMRFFFKLRQKIYYLKFKPDINKSPDKIIFKKLDENGVVLIENYLNKSKVKYFLNIINKDLVKISNRKYSKSEFYKSESDGKLVYNINEKSDLKIYDQLNNDQFVNDIVSSYIGKKVKPSSSIVELKYGKDKIDESISEHTDDWQYRVKAFFILEDVEIDNAPMRYFLNTHKNHEWKRNHDYMTWAFSATPLTPYLFRKIVDQNNIIEKICTAKAGSLILADTRGFHGGSILKTGRRIQLISIYNPSEKKRFRTA